MTKRRGDNLFFPRLASRKVFDGNVLEPLDPILVDQLDLEVGQVDDQPLLDLGHASLHQLVGLVSGHIWIKGTNKLFGLKRWLNHEWTLVRA